MPIFNVLGGLVQKIAINDLQFGRRLGEGGFGVVKQGKWMSRQADVAIKTVLTKVNFEKEVGHASVIVQDRYTNFLV